MPPVKKAKQQVKAAKEPEPTTDEPKVVSGQLKKKLIKQQSKQKEPRGVVFIKHLPHGFFEEQMQNYFEQFGTVTRLRLARSRRTGGSKGYAFVEFEYPEVAQVAAQTMDNYLMFKKLVKAAYIPPEKQVYNFFRTKVRKVKNKAGKDIYVSGKITATRRKVNKLNNWNQAAYEKRTDTQLKKIRKLKSKYSHLGIDFSKFIVEPKVLTAEERSAAIAAAAAEAKEETAAGSSKRKNADEGGNKKSTKKSKKTPGLVDLLGTTIDDESDDEDYIAMPESDNDDGDDDVDDEEDEATTAETSDEETYGFTKGSDDDDDEDEKSDAENDSDSDDDDETPVKTSKLVKPKKKAILPYGKPVKATKGDRFEELVKRKPKTGGIQKANKKPQKKPAVSKAKNQLLQSAAKELTNKTSALQIKKTKNAKSAVRTGKALKNKKKT